MMEKMTFFTIHNRSNYVEIANLFDRVNVYLRGHCIFMLDRTKVCYYQPFTSLFYQFPDFGKIPSTFTPENLYTILSTIPTQNPYVFIPLVIAELFALICVILGIYAFRKIYRKWMYIVCGGCTCLLILISVALGIANEIYRNVLPGYINKSMTVQVSREGVEFTLTGRLSDVGIKFHTETAMSVLVGILILNIIAFLVGIRWIFEGKKPVAPDVPSSRIRSMYAL